MYKFLLSIMLLLLVLGPWLASATDFSRLAGRIVLQVEKNGEAWYVTPDNLERFFLGRPSDAFALMREQGIGIKNSDLKKIATVDNDYDASKVDLEFSKKNSGKIFLQVEEQGQAWYVFPENNKRYYLGRPSDAFEIMRNLGLGISNGDLEELIALSIDFNLKSFEKEIHDLVNKEREKFDLKPLLLNEELSGVAREHSQNLAKENKAFTGLDAVCSYPLIHHEGLLFGAYQNDRLANRDILYYNMSGENIALLSSASITLTYQEGSIDEDTFVQCGEQQERLDNNFKEEIDNEEDEGEKLAMVSEEVDNRKEVFASMPRLKISSADWQESNELAIRAVDGWMNSPGHRKNILKEEYDEAGMGIAYVNSYVIITQVFIRKTDCGYEGAPCCKQDNYLICYQPNTCTDGVCK